MKILFEDCVRIEKKLYFICRDLNIFCSMDIVSGDIAIIDSLPEGSVSSWRLGAKIVNLGNYLYFAPMCADKIWRYDLTNGGWNGYERKSLDNWTENKDMFQAIVYKDKIYFIGAYYPAIIIMDTKTEEIEYVTTPYENRIKLSEERQDCWFRTDYVIKENLLYMASCVDNTILCFNMDTYDYKFIKVGDDSYTYSGIAIDGDKFYLTPRRNGPIVVWDGNNVERKIELNVSNPDNKVVFGGVISLEKKIVFFASFSNNSYELNKASYEVKKIDRQYLFYKKIDADTVVNLDNNGILEISLLDETYKHKVELSDSIIGQYMKKIMLERGEVMNEIIEETSLMTLGCFINML